MQVSNPAAPSVFKKGQGMTETKFKPPFHVGTSWPFIYDSENKLFCWCDSYETSREELNEIIVPALNLYYAKKGEKE